MTDHDPADLTDAELDALLAAARGDLLNHARQYIDLTAGLLAFMDEDITTPVPCPGPALLTTDHGDLAVIELRHLTRRAYKELPEGVATLRNALVQASLPHPRSPYLAFLLTLTHALITVRDIICALDRALTHDHNLTHDRARGHDRDLAHNRARALADGLDLAGTLQLSMETLGNSARTRTNALARVHALDGALDGTLGRARILARTRDRCTCARDRDLARAREFAGALAGEIAGTLASDLHHASDLAREVSPDPTSDPELARAHGLARSLDRAGNLALIPDLARVNVRLIAAALGSVTVNLSGADLSHLQDMDLEVLAGAVWTQTTTWPPDMRELVEKRSAEISDGVFRVRGGTEYDPRFSVLT